MAVAVIVFGAGPARADRGFWNYSPGKLDTFINVINTHATAAQSATVTFYGSAGGAALGVASQSIQPGGRWSFAVSAAELGSGLAL